MTCNEPGNVQARLLDKLWTQMNIMAQVIDA
jgi:hypothetical protein